MARRSKARSSITVVRRSPTGGPQAVSSSTSAPLPPFASLAAACLLMVAGVVLVFGQTISFDWVNFDDNVYVYNNPPIRAGLSWTGLSWAFSHFHGSNWHPLTWISHMLDSQVYGLWPGGHHLTNVVLHAAAACVLLVVLWQLTGQLWMSAFVAAIFAVHPLRAESVAWVAERKDLLSGLLFFLLLAAYIHYARRPFAWRRYLAVIAIFALGLLAKPMLVTAPLVLLLLDYWPLGRSRERGAGSREQGVKAVWLVEKLPLVAMAVASAIVTIRAQEGAIKTLVKVPLADRVANALVSYAIYLERFFWPVDLAAFYPYTARSPLGWAAIGGLLLIVAISAVAWALRRRVPSLLVGWLWYLIMMLPVIGLIQVGDQALADRYTYLPLIGPCLVLFSLPRGAMIPSRRPALAVAATCIVAVLLVAGWRQTTYWRDSRTLWNRALDCTKDNWLAHMNLGAAEFQSGETDTGVSEFQEALRLNPSSFNVHNNLGVMYLTLGKTDEAIAQFHAALEIEPKHAATHTSLGDALFQQGRLDDAYEQWNEALSFDPDDYLALNELAWAKATSPDAAKRDGAEAVQLALRAVDLSAGRDPEVLATLAAAYAEAGRFPEAISTLSRAIQLADARQKPEFANKLRGRLEIYRSGKPEYMPASPPRQKP